MQKRITLKTVAEAAGVSVSAVSMALRDHPRISETKREQIKALARELGYIYNRQAASLRQGTNDNISICVNDLHNPVFLEFLTAIERELRQSDKLVLLCNAHEECEIQNSFIRRMLEQGSSGLLLSPVQGTCPDTLRTIVQNSFPTVFFTRRLEDEGFDHVVSDDALGVELAVDELVRLGHRHIAWIGGGQQTSTAAARCEGFAAGLQKHGLRLTEAMVEKVPETNLEVGSAAMGRILRYAPEVTAVACFSDLLALGAASTCREAGRSVGQDISIIGHDDLEQSVYFDPGLSSVRVAKEEIGRSAARLLLKRIDFPEAPPEHETVAPSLILRGTTGPCPEH